MKNFTKSIIPLILILSLFVACGGSSKPTAEQIKNDLVGQNILIGGKIASVENVEILDEEEQPASTLKYNIVVEFTNSDGENVKENYIVYYSNSDNKGWKLKGAFSQGLAE